MRKFILALAAVAVLAIPAAAQAAIPVTSLTGDWAATNSTLRLTPNGVNFGVYPTAESGGSLAYTGANGLTLADITDLSYTFNYRALHEPENLTAAPYLRIFLEGDTQDVILDPSHCGTTPVTQNTDVTLQVVGNSVRYSDDGCDGVPPDEQPWADVVAAHGTEVISGIFITQGFAVGDSFSANVPQVTFNGEQFVFGAPQAGPAGPAGVDGATGANGPVGATGTAGATGAPGVTTTIVQQVPAQLTAPVVRTIGATVRTLTVPNRSGRKIVLVQAWLLTPKGLKRLQVRGRKIRVDLTGKPVGNYNVRIKTTYQRPDGSRFVRVTFRNLSVTNA